MDEAAPPKMMTAEEFMNADLGIGAHELFRGEVISSPPRRPSRTMGIARIARPLDDYGRRCHLGYVLPLCPVVTGRHPDTVREPDLAFYREDRWPRSQVGV